MFLHNLPLFPVSKEHICFLILDQLEQNSYLNLDLKSSWTTGEKKNPIVQNIMTEVMTSCK